MGGDDECAPDDLANVELDGGALLHFVDGARCGVEDEEVLLVDGGRVHEAPVGRRDRRIAREDHGVRRAALVGAHDMRPAFARKCGKGSQIAAGGGCRHRVAEGVAVHLDEYVDVGKLGIGFEMAVEEHGDVAVRELDDGHDVAFEQLGRTERLERALAGEEELRNDGERIGIELVDARAGDERGDGRGHGEGAQVLVRVLDEGVRIDEPGDVGAREGAGSEDHEVGVGCRGPTGVVEHLVHVARQVTDTWVYLCDCNAHAFLPR